MDASAKPSSGAVKSKECGIVKAGSRKLLAGIYRPKLGKSMRGIYRVVGMFSSSNVLPPSGKGSEMATLSWLNWYRNKLSLIRKKNVLIKRVLIKWKALCTFKGNVKKTMILTLTTERIDSQAELVGSDQRYSSFFVGLQDKGNVQPFCLAIYSLPVG